MIRRISKSKKPSTGTRINFAHPLAKNLVACYLFNEGAGGIIRDLARNNIGTITDAVWSKGRQGEGLLFDGNQDYIILEDRPSLKLNRGFSIVASFNSSSITTTQSILSHGQGEWYFRINGSKLNILESNVADIATASTTLVTGVDYQVGVTLDNNSTTNISFYVNGRGDGTGTTSNTLNDGTWPIHIGSDKANNESRTEFFVGVIHYIYIWNKKLTANEMKSIYSNPYDFLMPSRRFSVHGSAIVGATNINRIERKYNRGILRGVGRGQ